MPAGRGRMIFTAAWSGQTVAAVAGRRLSEGLGVTWPLSALRETSELWGLDELSLLKSKLKA